MKTQPSDLLIERFHLSLAPDLADWIDSLDDDLLFGGEFNEPISIAGILDARSATVWGGQMLPDTLPVVGNGGGDQICMRIGPTGTISEFIMWRHETGGWYPVAQSLPELTSFLEDGSSAGMDYRALSRCKSHLQTGLHRACEERGGFSLASMVGVKWEVFQGWLLDTRTIPASAMAKLQAELGKSAEELLSQNWAAASNAAIEVTNRRDDLAWAYAVAGYAAERSGEVDHASSQYGRGAAAPETSEAFVEMWHRPPGPKFVIRRLLALNPPIPEIAPPIVAASKNKDGIRDYWMIRGERAMKAGRPDEAYRYFWLAGWDDYHADGMDLILDRLYESAEAAQYKALAALARHHRAAID